MDHNNAGFMYLANKFPKIGDAKIKYQVFVGPQIRELLQEVNLKTNWVKWKKGAKKSFKNVTTILGGGDHKRQNYRDTVAALAQSCKVVGCIQ
jgi:hypothetical protein